MRICFVYCSKLIDRNIGLSEQHPCRLSLILGNDAKIYAMYSGVANEALFREHKVIPLKFRSNLINFGYLGKVIALIYHSWILGKKYKIDIFINVWDHYLMLPVWFSAKLLHKHAIASIGGIPISRYHYRKKESLSNIVRKQIGLLLEKSSLKAVDSIHLVAESLKKEFLSRGISQTKMTVISRGIDCDRVKYLSKCKNISFGKFNLGTIGRIAPIKDFETIINGFEIISNKYEDCFLHIVGNGDVKYIDRLKKIISFKKLQEKIFFYGQIKQKEIFNFLHQIDLFILASKSEGIANVVIEALACQLPVIATNVGDIPFHLKNGRGYIFKIGDYVKLSELIETVYFQKEETNENKRNREKYVIDEHSFRVLKRKYLRFFENTIKA